MGEIHDDAELTAATNEAEKLSAQGLSPEEIYDHLVNLGLSTPEVAAEAAGLLNEQERPYPDGAPGLQPMGSVREARRPKMCPYHKEVTDISLASGDPTSGFNAMAQHAWGAQHCQGEYEGGCNFKPAMVTQKYWDDKAEQAAERRERREQERAEQIQQEQTITEVPDVPDSPEGLEDTPAPLEEGSLDADLAEAPSAVGEGLETSEPVSDMGSLEPMAAAYNKKGEALKTIDVEQSEGPSPKIDKSKIPADGQKLEDVEMDGSPHPTKTIDPLEKIVPDNESDFLEGTKAVSEKQDVEQASSFNGDKAESGSWKGNNGASPVTSAAEQGHECAGCGKPVAEDDTVWVDPSTGKATTGDSGSPYHVGCAPDEGDNYLTSAVDPDKNPIIESLKSSFTPQVQVDQAIDEWNQNQ
jgi:hypothetical protein